MAGCCVIGAAKQWTVISQSYCTVNDACSLSEILVAAIPFVILWVFVIVWVLMWTSLSLFIGLASLLLVSASKPPPADAENGGWSSIHGPSEFRRAAGATGSHVNNLQAVKAV